LPLTERQTNFKLSSLPFAISVPSLEHLKPQIAFLKAILLHLTERQPNFELSSLPLQIGVPMHNDTVLVNFNIPVRKLTWPSHS